MVKVESASYDIIAVTSKSMRMMITHNDDTFIRGDTG